MFRRVCPQPQRTSERPMPWPDDRVDRAAAPLRLAAAGEALHQHLRVVDAEARPVVAHHEQRVDLVLGRSDVELDERSQPLA